MKYANAKDLLRGEPEIGDVVMFGPVTTTPSVVTRVGVTHQVFPEEGAVYVERQPIHYSGHPSERPHRASDPWHTLPSALVYVRKATSDERSAVGLDAEKIATEICRQVQRSIHEAVVKTIHATRGHSEAEMDDDVVKKVYLEVVGDEFHPDNWAR